MGETSVLSIQHIGEMEMEAQRAFCEENKRLLLARYGRPPKALVRAFGCAQNMDDGEKIKGMLAQMGCQFTDSVEEADIALYNTCAIRENAEQEGLRHPRPGHPPEGVSAGYADRPLRLHGPAERGFG